jgi:hypothetical protein
MILPKSSDRRERGALRHFVHKADLNLRAAGVGIQLA